jgi:hypothetical protein
MSDHRCRLCNPESSDPVSFCSKHAIALVNGDVPGIDAGPIAWTDDEGTLHLSAEGFLRAQGWPEEAITPEAIDAAQEMLARLVEEMVPEAEISRAD